MADKKISQLNPILVATSSDLLPIVNSSETKRITVESLMGSPGPVGAINPNTGEFTTLTLLTGSTIDEFSTDVTLAGSSNTAVPTERAVKTYVDSLITGVSNKITQGDSNVEVLDSTAVPYASVTINIDGNMRGRFTNAGFGVASGSIVNEISNDPTLGDNSQISLVTEYAIKQYVDNFKGISDRIVDGLVSAKVTDSTESSFVVKVRDTYFGPDSTTYTSVYYFNDGTGVSSLNWINPQRMVDGNTETFASAGSAQGAYIQINPSNTADATASDRNVEKVELRVYGRDGAGPNISAFNLYPMFGGILQGNSQNLRSFFGPVRSWTPWINITKDPNAPDSWTWSDVVNLGCKVEAMIGSPGGGVGDLLEVNKIEIQVTYTSSPAVVGSKEKFRVDVNGLTTEFGSSINEFSTDITMADNSDLAIPTERAVKTYVDFQIQSVRNDLDLINIRHVNSDTTAVTGDVCLVNTNSGVVNIQMIEIPDGRVIIKKVSLDSNPIYVTTTPSSGIDGERLFVIDVPYKSITFLSDGNQFFII